MKIIFKIGTFEDKTTVIRDELHLHMSPPDPLDREIFKPFVLRFKDIHTNQLIRKFKVPAFNQGWQVLSLNKWTNKWIKDPSSNEGVLLTIRRGGARKLANKNPFINFPKGNDPYLVFYATDSVQSVLAWRFLIQRALNTVAGNTQTRKRITRDTSLQSQGQRVPRDMSLQAHGRRVTRNTSQQSQGQQVTHNTSQQSQCTAVETDVNLTNLKVAGRFFIDHPKVYRMINCSNSCVMRLAKGHPNTTQNSDTTLEQYCCVPTKRRDLAVMLKDPTTRDLEVLLVNIVPTGCTWSRQ